MATTIILLASPIFFLLIFIELWLDVKKESKVYRFSDAITSLSLGVISQTQKFVLFSVAALVYAWLAKMFSFIEWNKESSFAWIAGFVLYDFFYYWYHRFSHQINFLWAAHVVHHQSEEYNLTTALRQTSSSIGAWLFYVPCFIIGMPAEIFFVSGALNLVYQFWVHTQLIDRLGWFEKVFVTPSHHRVHHGQNQEYIDKNHGGVFILWDKWFGTFQQELADVKVIYGVRRAVSSFNPVWANLHTWYSLLLDAIRTKSWKDKIKIWFMPTGWRPDDVSIKFPIQKIKPEQLIKYSPKSSASSKYYVFYQYVISLLLGVIFVLFQNQIELYWRVIFWVLITLPLITCSLFLENRSKVFALELFRLALSASFILYWYLANTEVSAEAESSKVFDYLGYFLLGYFVISLLACLALVKQQSNTEEGEAAI